MTTLYRAPASYTGEDMLEISAHGNPIILRRLVEEIVSRETVRIAEPGEFTARALANKKVSLDQVESIDLILNSESLEGVKRGVRAKLDGMGIRVRSVSEAFLEIIAELQAHLDFSESEVGALELGSIESALNVLKSELVGWVQGFEATKHFFQRWVVVLLGPPNSGKSSLFNALIRQDRAIVYNQPGTTRDHLEHPIDIEGLPVLFVDTAGIHTSDDPIETLGIEKTFEVARRADLIVWVDEAGQPPDSKTMEKLNFLDKKFIFARSKADLSNELGGGSEEGWLRVSALSGEGVEMLKAKVLPNKSTDPRDGSWAAITSIRQKDLVQASIDHIEASIECLRAGEYLDMVTERLLMASRAIQSIVDPPNDQSVLQRIFSRFCIGK
jgi:tRNA modification GTPase